MKEKLALTDKWIVVDLDGTILHNDRVPPKVSRSAQMLQASGWSLIVATGRILAGALPHIRSLKTSCPAIVYDGARVMDPRTNEVYFERKIPKDLVGEIISMGFDFPLEVQVYGDEEVLCRPSDLLTITYFKSLNVAIEPVLLSPKLEKDVFRVLFFGKPALVAKLKVMFEETLKGKVSVTLAGSDFLDVLPLGVSKGEALEVLKGLSGIKDVYVVGVGDHMNDLELLSESDYKVAPADAIPEILKIADFIMPPASKEGFCDLCELLLSENFDAILNRRCRCDV
ncbi:MAG TPA: HAD family hydrolase [Acetomicrobium sp.]|nr:HAD family hydrolase [Acetomicrobium sp.]